MPNIGEWHVTSINNEHGESILTVLKAFSPFNPDANRWFTYTLDLTIDSDKAQFEYLRNSFKANPQRIAVFTFCKTTIQHDDNFLQLSIYRKGFRLFWNLWLVDTYTSARGIETIETRLSTRRVLMQQFKKFLGIH